MKGAKVIPSELGQPPRVVERINQWLKAKQIILLKDGGFNHYRVARVLLPMLTETSLSASDLEPFEELFTRVNKVLG